MNLVMLIGNLAADPEVRSLPRGTTVANLRLAVNDRWTDRQTGEKRERTHWFNLVVYGRQAETAAKYLRKGHKLAVQGNLEYREWQAQDGSKRSAVEVRVQNFEMLTPRSQSGGAASAASGAPAAPGRGPESGSGDNDRSDQPPSYYEGSPPEGYDPGPEDDLPF